MSFAKSAESSHSTFRGPTRTGSASTRAASTRGPWTAWRYGLSTALTGSLRYRRKNGQTEHGRRINSRLNAGAFWVGLGAGHAEGLQRAAGRDRSQDHGQGG